LEQYSRSNPGITVLEDELYRKVGVRLIDFVDHLVVDSEDMARQLEGYGYVHEGMVRAHPGAALPRVVVSTPARQQKGAAVKVDSIAQFLMVRGLALPIEGSPYSAFRRCEISTSNGVTFWVVERRFTHVFEPVAENAEYLELYFNTLERWQNRPRRFEDDDTAMAQTLALAEQQIQTAGVDLAAYLFIEAEQQFWESRSRAARIHKNHADMMGMGWANRDHHTYRNSRQTYAQVLKFFQDLGFKNRERFYAGEEAGWGAQVMENPVIDVSLFLDVDLSPEELDIDFMKEKLPFTGKIGTVGLWCALHGLSMVQAGLHHVALRSHFDRLPEVLKNDQVKMMGPFSNFPHLKQQFTYADNWPVKEERIETLLKQGMIDRESADKFSWKGAVGSHVENIQRADGHKGFSQKRISAIITDTNPVNYDLE
jgi:hypothetical protein